MAVAYQNLHPIEDFQSNFFISLKILEFFCTEIHKIGTGNNRKRHLGIKFLKGGRHFRVLVAPFELKGFYFAVAFFNQINFLPGISAPEIILRPMMLVVVHFDALRNQEILPEYTNILPECKRAEIADNGIADTVVVEISRSS